jgi:hypothetical protein
VKGQSPIRLSGPKHEYEASQERIELVNGMMARNPREPPSAMVILEIMSGLGISHGEDRVLQEVMQGGEILPVSFLNAHLRLSEAIQVLKPLLRSSWKMSSQNPDKLGSFGSGIEPGRLLFLGWSRSAPRRRETSLKV